MSVSPTPQGLSIPINPERLITVIVLIVIVTSPVAEIVSAYADAAALVTLLLGGCGTAVMYRNRNS
ncbi:hypothetical protein ACIQUU_30495 [Streptomyces sp. NPDC101116]|uniref:hypothetical protein n=1 Tax=Streptomyces sp. NPDC101116 TaxID=3366107 RepID=UPI003830753E